MATVTGKVGCSKPIMVDAFEYLQSITGAGGVTRATPKVTIPSPSMLYMRGGRDAVSSTAYPDLAQFWHDVAAAYQRAIRYFAERGCSYLQLDDVSFAYLCDPKFREGCRRNGDDPDTLPQVFANAVNAAFRGRPKGMTSPCTLAWQLQKLMGCRRRLREHRGGHVFHRCRRLLHGIRFRPCGVIRTAAFNLPAGKKAVLGLVTTKQGAIEGADEIKRRIADSERIRADGEPLSVAAMRILIWTAGSRLSY